MDEPTRVLPPHTGKCRFNRRKGSNYYKGGINGNMKARRRRYAIKNLNMTNMDDV